MQSQHEELRHHQRQAYLIDISGDQRVAVSAYNAFEVLESPKIVPVPGCAGYAYGVLKWQTRWIALIDLAAFIFGRKKTSLGSQDGIYYALVVAYRDSIAETATDTTHREHPIAYGAIYLAGVPEIALVHDKDSCLLPATSQRWKDIALSCIKQDGSAVPIISPGAIFSSGNHIQAAGV